MSYQLKEVKTQTFKNLGEVKTIVVSGPKKEYAFFKYSDGRIHQVGFGGYAKHENSEALEITKAVA